MGAKIIMKQIQKLPLLRAWVTAGANTTTEQEGSKMRGKWNLKL
jgi:hypothetical protein